MRVITCSAAGALCLAVATLPGTTAFTAGTSTLGVKTAPCTTTGVNWARIRPQAAPAAINTKSALSMVSGSPGDGFSFKQPMLNGVNNQIVTALVAGEGGVLAFAGFLTWIGRLNPLANFAVTPEAAATAAVAAIPIFLISVLLERSNIRAFQKIDRDTQLFIVQLFGVKRDVGAALPAAALLSASAAIAEELLFRGVLQAVLSFYLGPIGGLIGSSFLFGLAHAPVPGASAFVESGYGLAFGILYGATGNLFVPILAHFLYDFASFIEVHLRATSNVGLAAGGKLPEPKLSEKANQALQSSTVKDVINKYSLPPLFLEQAVGVFRLLDLDDNGSLEKQEFKLGMRTFGRFSGSQEMDSLFASADTNNDGMVDFGEFFTMLANNVAQASAAMQKGRGGSK